MVSLKEPLNKWLRRRSAALRGTHTLAYLLDMSRVLRSVRLASHPARSLIQRLLKRATAIALALLLAGGCSDLQSRRDNAEQIAQRGGLQRQVVDGGPFQLLTYSRQLDSRAPLRIYIEGDGFAWVTRTQRSVDPTPYDPLALKLASRDPAPNILYIARPCQYLGVPENPRCVDDLWSDGRFAEAVIAATQRVIGHYVKAGQGIELVGYSGGAAVALLVAARRNDVVTLRTVAGNLDNDTFTRIHGVTPLDASLNPKDVAPRLASLPQRHFVGGEDRVITPEVARAYLAAVGESRCVSVETVGGTSHNKGWEERWGGLLAQPVACR